MAHNNDAFYDAVVAGAGGSTQGWFVDQLTGDYSVFADAVSAIATAVDLQIPAMATGPNGSQVRLLMSITQAAVLWILFPKARKVIATAVIVSPIPPIP